MRTADNVTTKVRPVLNCSLKIGNSPSLNEACFGGINLLKDLFSLLIKSRKDKFLVISDIKQAFLMVFLNKESDRDRFRILWYDTDGKLIAYRYRTIVFGQIASPFILNYVLDYHLKNYAEDECTLILRNNIYVDNLFMTGEDLQKLHELCTTARERFLEGGFELRSWASNSHFLRDVFEDLSIQSNSLEFEKLLGYEYSTVNDTIQLTAYKKIDVSSGVTKRKILSAVASVFDPLGLYIPVTVRGKILLQKVWKMGVEWDTNLPCDIVRKFGLIQDDLCQINSIAVPRKA